MPDSDGDGLELRAGTLPLSSDAVTDSDLDGVRDLEELARHRNPRRADEPDTRYELTPIEAPPGCVGVGVSEIELFGDAELDRLEVYAGYTVSSGSAQPGLFFRALLPGVPGAIEVSPELFQPLAME